jgi:hypothetical protein
MFVMFYCLVVHLLTSCDDNTVKFYTPLILAELISIAGMYAANAKFYISYDGIFTFFREKSQVPSPFKCFSLFMWILFEFLVFSLFKLKDCLIFLLFNIYI